MGSKRGVIGKHVDVSLQVAVIRKPGLPACQLAATAVTSATARLEMECTVHLAGGEWLSSLMLPIHPTHFEFDSILERCRHTAVPPPGKWP